MLHPCHPLTRFCVSLLGLAGLTVAAVAVPEGTTDLDSRHPGVSEPTSSAPAPEIGRAGGAPPVMPGWPQTMGVTVPFAPVGVVLADVDHDGNIEVVAGSTDNRLRIWTVAGSLITDVNAGGRIQSKPAVADLDGDGDLEIVVATAAGQLQVFHHDGTSLSGWPQASGFTFGLLSPVVYNLDGEGLPEVLVGGGSMVRAWNADGTVRSGFPVSVGSTIVATLAVGDLAGDDGPEIAAIAGGNVHVLHADGTAATGFPQSFGLSASYAAPSIGDLENDGDNEVLAVGYEFGSFTRIHAYHGDGTAVAGFPVQYPSGQTYSCPVIGDVDGDGDLELFNAGKVELAPTFYAWDHTGTVLPGWPTPGGSNMEGSASIVNLDADPELEVVIADNSTTGLAYNLDGTVVDGFPFTTYGSSLPDAPSLADADGDGDLDLALTAATGDVALWDLPVTFDAASVEWGQLFHDRWNTNQHGFVVPEGPVVSVPSSDTVAPVAFAAARPNPFRTGTTLTVRLEAAGDVTAVVHDVTGREVRRLATRHLDAGTHLLDWDGRDDAGAEVAAGVYVVRVTTADGAASRVVVRL